MGDLSSERTTFIIKNWFSGLCRHVMAGEVLGRVGTSFN
jgi:hypothetical protein